MNLGERPGPTDPTRDPTPSDHRPLHEPSPTIKQKNFDLLLAGLRRPGPIALNRPLQLFIEVTSACNLRCVKCALSYDLSLNKGSMIPFSVFSRLSDFFDAAVEVQTFGFGEMFLYPFLRNLVELLKRHDCRVAGVTNGTHIREADVEWLVANRYDDLTFSIDGATAETMRRLRGADLGHILERLDRIAEAKATAKSRFPRIIVNFVAQADNFRELPELVRLLTSRNVFFLGVNPLHHVYGPSGPYEEYYEKHCLGTVSRAEFEAVIAEAARLAETAGIQFQNYVSPDFEWRPSRAADVASQLQDDEASEPLPAMYCRYPWTTLYLAANRTAKVCCYMSQHENLGTFSTVADAADVWNGPKLMEVRDAIRKGRVHPACRQCVRHRTYETHGAVMRGIRESLAQSNSLVGAPAQFRTPVHESVHSSVLSGIG